MRYLSTGGKTYFGTTKSCAKESSLSWSESELKKKTIHRNTEKMKRKHLNFASGQKLAS